MRTLLGVALAAIAVLVVACGSDDPDPAASGSSVPAAGEQAAAESLEEGRTVIDVRTPEEYAAGHVSDATLIDVQSPEFGDLIDELDPSGEYVVYCRSGNRSAVATESMTGTGLDVWDGGGLGDMEAAGWPTSVG